MPGEREHNPLYLLSIRNMAFTLNFSGKRRSLLNPNTAQRSFFPLQSYSKETLRKIALKGTCKLIVNRMCSCPLGIP